MQHSSQSAISSRQHKSNDSRASNILYITENLTKRRMQANETIAERTQDTAEWVQPVLFEDVLRQRFDKFSRIKSMKTVPGLSPGENYSTIMVRVHLEVELKDATSKHISYMLKLPHDFESYRELLKKSNMFAAEREAYLRLVPELEQMYRDVGVNVKFCAEAFELNAPDEYVLLEDLSPKGFKNANRLEGLDMVHTKAVLKKLAYFHAASAVRVERKGMYDHGYSLGPYKESTRAELAPMMNGMGTVMLQCLHLYKGHELFGDAVRRTQNVFMDQMYKLAQPDPNDFNVLNHGDCWINNIMFQYDDLAAIREIYFVDYQLPKYGTVAQDLLYFLLTSTKLELKLKHFDYFIRYYHENLIESLHLFNYPKQKIPTLRYLHNLLFKYGIYGYHAWLVCLAPVLLDNTSDANFEDFATATDGGDLRLKMYSNDRYRKHAEAILPWLYNRGALET